MVSDERCVMGDSRVGEDVVHFLVGCGEISEIGRYYWMVCAELWGLGEW